MPRAIEQYFACESIRTPGFVIPRRDAILALVPWSEWPASTDSQKDASDSVSLVSGFMAMGVRVVEVNGRCEEGSEGQRGGGGVIDGARRAGGTYGESAVSLDGDEEDAALRVLIVEVDGEVWATGHPDDNLAVDEEAKADGVLPTAKESLGSVDRVKRPVPYIRREPISV